MAAMTKGPSLGGEGPSQSNLDEMLEGLTTAQKMVLSALLSKRRVGFDAKGEVATRFLTARPP
jgi:hypothetical protein